MLKQINDGQPGVPPAAGFAASSELPQTPAAERIVAAARLTY
jgi:hypothetical protein